MLAATLTAVALLPVPLASAAEGERSPTSEYPSSLLPQGGSAPSAESDSGGASYSPAIQDQAQRRQTRKKTRDKPVLASFDLSRTAVFAYGRPATISFRIDDRSRYVRVGLAVVRESSGGVITRYDLGRKRSGRLHKFRWRGFTGPDLAPQGGYHFRLSARDPDGNSLLRSSQSLGGTPLELRDHRFPVAGPHNFGGPDARFGARRPGHSHEGQDITAAEGTPVVAPRAGLITWRAYQARGAGHYLVLAGENEAYNYVFMHLRGGSLLVKQGDFVRTGQQLAQVGSTGESSGPHLHFEIWNGPWRNGGKPIDPLPLLQVWDAYS
jgi:murein DD-endopeptidase MepM/ murein hydrolase activator NlpD